jgi:hypothetical protein
MKRIMTITTGMALAIFLSLTMSLLNVSLAQAQEGPTTGLMIAGTYVEEDPEAGSPRVVVIYGDGNLTIYNPPDSSLMFGIWEEVGETPTATSTSTDTETSTDTSTDTSTTTGSVSLRASVVDTLGETSSYTLEFDGTFTSLTLTNGDTEATFTRVAIDGTGTDTDGTGTDTSTGTGTDTSTGTGTGTSTGTGT